MISEYRIIRASARHLANAANGAVDDFRDALVEQEPQITERMLGRMAEAMSGYETRGVRWTAKTLTDRGARSQEREYGADFIGVLEINLPGYAVKKGFLAQAKRSEPGESISPAEQHRMLDQCEQMLRLSPDSFIFVYSMSGFTVVPAVSVLSSAHNRGRVILHELPSRKISTFYEGHFGCFIGDRSISSPELSTLERLRAKHLLYLLATYEEPRRLT